MLQKYIKHAKKIMEKLQAAGVEVNPGNYDFMYSHIPQGELKKAPEGIEKQIYENANKEQFSMYVHIPFCANKCKYCRFTAFSNQQEGFIDKYLNYMLEKELPLLAQIVDLKSDNLKVIYMGGGTPTYLKEPKLENLLRTIREYTNEKAKIELEAHPNTITDEKLKILKNYGIERLSIGVQSFNDNLLAAVGREQTTEQAINSIKEARKIFDNLNIDLIFGLPFQTINDIKKDIDIIRGLDIPSVTWYQLWILSRETGKRLDIDKKRALSDLEMMATKIMINEELSKNGYFNIYNDWYLKSEKITPQYEKFRINAQNNVGIGLSPYLFVKPFIFENTDQFKEYFNKIDNEHLPIAWYKKMNEFELEARRIAMNLKNGKISDINFDKLEEPIKKRIDNLIQNKILICDGKDLKVSEEFIKINKDYLSQYILGDKWFIKKKH
ncbi:MAG: radical SAM protein [Candidatus Pacearchaeota archaeon]|nr:radical SAM protein [Candidatus Pacearchaeota archaeon]